SGHKRTQPSRHSSLERSAATKCSRDFAQRAESPRDGGPSTRRLAATVMASDSGSLSRFRASPRTLAAPPVWEHAPRIDDKRVTTTARRPGERLGARLAAAADTPQPLPVASRSTQLCVEALP